MPTKRTFGNIRKLPSGRFQARFTAPDGTAVKAPTTFQSKARANDWLALQHADLIRHDWVDPALGSLTVQEYALAWLAGRGDLRLSTRTLYADHVRRFVSGPYVDQSTATANPRLGDRTLRQVSTSHVIQWHRWVCEVSAAGTLQRAHVAEGSPRWNRALRAWAQAQPIPIARTGRIPQGVKQAWVEAGCPGLTPATNGGVPGATQAAQAYRTLHAIFASAEHEGRIAKNPCSIKGAGQCRARRRRPATEAEVQAIAEAMPARYAAAVLVAAWGALRAGEIFGLARKHVDLERGAVRVERAFNGGRGDSPRFGPPKTDAGVRTVHLPPGIVTRLQEHMAVYTPLDPDALVFGTRSGTPLASSNRSAMFRRAANSVGRPDLHFHDLRHTGATLAAEAGASTAQLMHRLGHTTPRAALVYQHTFDESDRRLAVRLGLGIQ